MFRCYVVSNDVALDSNNFVSLFTNNKQIYEILPTQCFRMFVYFWLKNFKLALHLFRVHTPRHSTNLKHAKARSQ